MRAGWDKSFDEARERDDTYSAGDCYVGDNLKQGYRIVSSRDLREGF
jgi:hypothetical protein